MNEIERTMQFIEMKHICEFCTDIEVSGDCFDCKTAKAYTIEELHQGYALILQSLQEKSDRENPQPLTANELQEMVGQWVHIRPKTHEMSECRKLTGFAPYEHSYIFYFSKDNLGLRYELNNFYQHPPKEDTDHD